MSRQKPSELFPARLRAARELRQINQTDLALKIGLPATSISHFESGSRKPSFDNLRRIAEQLNVTADYLLGRVEEPTALAGADKLHRLRKCPDRFLVGQMAEMHEIAAKLLADAEELKAALFAGVMGKRA